MSSMKSGRIIGFLKYMVVCLALVAFDKADDALMDSKTTAETASLLTVPEEDFIDTNIYSFSVPENQCRIPRNSNLTTSLRTFSSGQRQNTSNFARNGFTIVKNGKSMNEYTTNLFFVSLYNFPSGMNESSHRLIGLRKLII